MKRATFVCLLAAIFVTISTPVTELISDTLYNFMYWSSIILYILAVLLLIKEEKNYGWPYKD